MRQIFKKELPTILYRTWLILAAVQILLGVIWICGNFTMIPGFLQTREWIDIADTLVTDQYTGILYPLLIRAAMFLERFSRIPFQCYLYALQLAVGYLAITRGLRHLRCPRPVFTGLWVMTLPTLLQMFLAVRPEVLGACILLSCLVSCHGSRWLEAASYWLICALLLPELFWIGGFLLLTAFVFSLRGNKDKRRSLQRMFLYLLAVSVLWLGAARVTREPYSRGRMERTVWSTALQRVVWPNYQTTSFFWTDEVLELFSQEELMELSQNPENPVRQFGPVLEQTYGTEKAQEIYRQMVQVTLEMNTKQVLTDIGADLLWYSLPPMALLIHLEGIGVGYSGWNYMWMTERLPVFTACYVRYGNVLFLVTLLAALLTAIFRKNRRNKLKGLLLGGCGLQILWYTVCASGMQDYTQVPFVTIVYGILIGFGLQTGQEEADYENV